MRWFNASLFATQTVLMYLTWRAMLPVSAAQSPAAMTGAWVYWPIAAMAVLALAAWAPLVVKWLKNRRSVTPSNIEKFVRQWAEAFRFGIQTMDKNPIVKWGVTLTQRGVPAVTVAQEIELDRYLSLTTMLGLHPAHMAAYEKLTNPQKEKIKRTIRMELAGDRMEWLMPTIEKIVILRRVPITESLTEGEFVKAIGDVTSMTMIVSDRISIELESYGGTKPTTLKR